jgi:hypothetical protein
MHFYDTNMHLKLLFKSYIQNYILLSVGSFHVYFRTVDTSFVHYGAELWIPLIIPKSLSSTKNPYNPYAQGLKLSDPENCSS